MQFKKPRGCLFHPVSGTFLSSELSDNAGEALFVKYVIGIRVVSMEVVCPAL